MATETPTADRTDDGSAYASWWELIDALLLLLAGTAILTGSYALAGVLLLASIRLAVA